MTMRVHQFDAKVKIPNSDWASEQIMSLPLHPQLSLEQQERVVSSLAAELSERS